MDTTDAPQILEHVGKSLTFTPFDVKWIPSSARLVLFGQSPRAKGVFQIYQLNKGQLELLSDFEKEHGIKCGTFKASPVSVRDVATVDYQGKLVIFDIEKGKSKFSVQAHAGMANVVDGIGGKGPEFGAPELVTGGVDGCVRVWDPRQEAPVVSLEPAENETIKPDCWTVAFGNSYNAEERCIAAGYDNGDIKLFDLKTNCLRWDTNVGNGICGLEFDRPDIAMNKLVVTTLESKFHVFDLKTQHPEKGCTGLSELAHKSTIWGARHFPQNRDLFTTLGGNGSINLYKYHYPANRSIKDLDGLPMGVVGKLELLNEKSLAQQPIVSLDWNTDKFGLGCLSILERTIMENNNFNQPLTGSQVKQKSCKEQSEPWIVIAGGFSVHLFLGCFYLWGNISQYVVSYLYHFDPDVTIKQMLIIIPLIAACQMCSNPFGAFFQKRVNNKILLSCATLYAMSGVFISSFMTNHVWFIIFYSVIYGSGIGLAYFTPLVCGWEWMPERKGLVSGIVIGGFGFGSFFFGLLSMQIVNPGNASPTLKNPAGEKLYPYQIAENVPYMLRLNVCIWFVLSAIAVALVRRNPKFQAKEKKDSITYDNLTTDEKQKMESQIKEINNKKSMTGLLASPGGQTPRTFVTFQEGLRVFKLYHMWIMAFCSAFYGLYMASVFKTFASSQASIDDLTLTAAGSIGGIMNGAGRIVWAGLQDKVGFKTVYAIILAIQIIVSGTIYFVVTWNKYVYVIWIALGYSCVGAHFSIFPTVCTHIFGMNSGGLLYSVLYTAFGTSAIAGYVASTFLLDSIGNEAFFFIGCGMTCISAIFLFFFEATPIIKEVDYMASPVESPQLGNDPEKINYTNISYGDQKA